jgi:DNA replication protein DnaC
MSAAPVDPPEAPRIKRAGASDVARLLRGMPPEAHEWAARANFDFADAETPEEKRARVADALAARGRKWEARVPSKFRDSRLDRLRPEQHPDKVRAWLASDSPTLVLASGITGNGKTDAAYALGWAVHEAGQWASAWTMADLNAALRPSGEHEPDAWHTVTTCDLLIIDDLGTERRTDWTGEQLHRLFDTRGRERRRTVVTTNLTSAEVEERYDSRVADRLLDDSMAIRFTGQSMRKPRAW